ncbi:MAG: phosphoribosylglycinamide formyltransferase [Clostridia bacterium]|nr:phosphoribosylglycinamide formyltransferase [Clostridia bacterium]
MKRIGVLVSGGGTNLQAILDACESGLIKSGKVVTVVSNKKDVYALERAKNANVEGIVIEKKAFDSIEAFDEALCAHMKSREVDLIVMAGFLCIVGDKLISEFENRIINIHPSLIPSFCGAGFYGLRVHEAALNYGVKVSGATVHYVNGVVDGGKIIKQKAVYIKDDDTPETLQKRIMEEAEWKILPEAIEEICASM